MISTADLLTDFYGRLLHLYPGEYQREYAEELQTVFNMAAAEATLEDRLAMLRLVCCELRDLPAALVHEHMRARRKKLMQNDASHPSFKPPSWKEKLGTVLPYLVLMGVLGLYAIHTFAPGWLVWVFFGLLLLFPVILIVGLARGLPRWCMPYLGFVAFFFLGVASDTPPYKNIDLNFATAHSPFWFQAFSVVGEMWLEIFIVLGLLLLITALVPPFRAFFRRVRLDWTQLSFVMYGAALFDLFLFLTQYEDFHPYMLLPVLAIGGGAWLYMRTPGLWGRFLVLFGGITVTNLLLLIGLKLGALHGGTAFSTYGHSLPRDWAYMLLMWGWQTIALLAPAVLMLLSKPRPAATEATPAEG
jgi:hypothetical protein